MLGEFNGTMQNDGYAAYWCYNEKRRRELGLEMLEISCCWAHARRKLHEAKAESALAREMLKEISELCLVETSLRDSGGSVAERKAVRGEKSRHVLDRIKKRLEQDRSRHLPHITNVEARELTPTKWLAARQAESMSA
jgi:transposase